MARIRDASVREAVDAAPVGALRHLHAQLGHGCRLRSVRNGPPARDVGASARLGRRFRERLHEGKTQRAASLFPEASFLHLAGARQQVVASSAPTPRVAPPDTTDEQARRSLSPGRFW